MNRYKGITLVTSSIVGILLTGGAWRAIALSSSAIPSPTPQTAITPSVSASPSETQVQSVKNYINKAKTNPQVQGLMTQLETPRFGIVGVLEKAVGSTLQVRSVTNVLHIIELDISATVLKNQHPLSLNELELNTPVIVMGTKDKDHTLTGKRLIIGDDTTIPLARASLYGKVDSIGPKSLTLENFKNGAMQPTEVKLSYKTQYFSMLNTPLKKTDIKPSDLIVALYSGDETATSSALRVYSFSTKTLPTPLPL